MIVRMAKVEIVGPKELLLEVISLMQEVGRFQLEPDAGTFLERGEEAGVRPLALDEKTVTERVFYEDLGGKIDTLLSYLPQVAVRTSYLEPLTVVDAVAGVVERHLASCGELRRKREGLAREKGELERHSVFLGTLEPLLAGVEEKTGFDFIGVTVRELSLMERLVEALARRTGGRFEIVTARQEDGTIVGLITTDRKTAETVRRLLHDERVPELAFPESLRDYPFPEKMRRLRERIVAVEAEIAGIDRELERFALRWGAIYRRVREWIDGRLSLLRTTAFVHETGMCFFIHGWMPAAELNGLAAQFRERFGGRVVAQEKQIHEQELDRVPVALKNPPYFRPFELFSRLLPLPRYTSYDPTPFIGIFFPIFFGMMVGDMGHGLLLLIASLLVLAFHRKSEAVRDAARIFLICSTYAILFGLVYGEFFCDLGRRLFHLEGFGFERSRAVMPMLFFTVTVGVAHVTLGLFLGFVAAVRKKTKKEALFKLLNIGVILCIAALVASIVVPSPWLLRRPIVIAIAFLVPFLFITGGILAPLELLKNIGNIISYARIMAIGLASVMLANAANRFAGITGDIVIGTLAAVLLHAINIVLGVFAPTVHALRLHFVEFFSKFLEHGGSRFEPFKK